MNLANRHKNKKCVIVGKSPTFQQWQNSGYAIARDVVVISINNGVFPALPTIQGKCEAIYGVTTDDWEWLKQMPEYPQVQWFHGTPVWEGDRWAEKREAGQEWFVHGNQGDEWILEQTKEQLDQDRRFYCHVSSLNPAIHLAWLFGCQKPILIGIGGGGGYAEVFGTTKTSDTDYQVMANFGVQQIYRLWNVWR
jgi:hypothetical protein